MSLKGMHYFIKCAFVSTCVHACVLLPIDYTY